MKIFLHRNGNRNGYGDERLKLIDTVTGQTYFLGSVFWTEREGFEEHGRISVAPTRETAEVMQQEDDSHTINYYMRWNIHEFSERFIPLEIVSGDWFLFKNSNGEEKVGHLTITGDTTYTLVNNGVSYNVPKTDCTFYATREVPEGVVNNIILRSPVPEDIVCLKSDVTKIGKISQRNWRSNLMVVDYYDNSIELGQFNADELTVLSKEKHFHWGSFTGAIEDAANPRIREGNSGATHQVYPSMRRNNTELRHYERYGIPEVMKQYVPQLGRTVQTKRFNESDWVIDMTTEDHTTPQGAVQKTWYVARSSRNDAHELWLMQAMKRYKEVYGTVLATLPVLEEGVPMLSGFEEDAELLTATQRIEQAAARFREESAQRAEAARLERIRIDAEAARIAAVHAAERAERQRRQAEEDAKKSIWNYHILKPKVQNP